MVQTVDQKEYCDHSLEKIISSEVVWVLGFIIYNRMVARAQVLTRTGLDALTDPPLNFPEILENGRNVRVVNN